MSNELIETVKELRLLGWSEEGAKSYTELLLADDVDIITINKFIILFFLAILLLIIYISTKRYLSSEIGRKSIKRRKESNYKAIKSASTRKEAVHELKVLEKSESNILEQKVSNANDMKISSGNNDQAKKSFDFKTESNDFQKPNIAKKFRRPLKDHFIDLYKETSIDTDKSIEPIILLCIIIYDLSIELLKISLSFFTKKQQRILTPSPNNFLPNSIYNKDEKELINILDGIEIVSNLSKNQLIDLIASSPLALKKLALEERRSFLMKKTNLELKSLLKGVRNISRLKKKELVEKILSLER